MPQKLKVRDDNQAPSAERYATIRTRLGLGVRTFKTEYDDAGGLGGSKGQIKISRPKIINGPVNTAVLFFVL